MKSPTNNSIVISEDGCIRLSALVRGKMIPPPDIKKSVIEKSFADEDDKKRGSEKSTVISIENARVLREPIIDRNTMLSTGEYLYQITPKIRPEQVIEDDINQLSEELYNLNFDEILIYLEGLQKAFWSDSELLEQVRKIVLQTSEAHDLFIDAGFSMFPVMLGKEQAETMIDTDLSIWNIPGRRFLQDWVEVPGTLYPAPVHMIHAEKMPPISNYDPTTATPKIRALPTRQLHITAGNSPLVPLISILRAIWTKSAATIKLPYGATLSGTYLAHLAFSTFPEHPITRHLSILYWPGGDEEFETPLYIPGRYDRIVVWGAPDAVLSVTARATFTKTVTFNPRYGVSLIGKEAFRDLKQVVSRSIQDTLIQSQKACIASQIHYIEGSQSDAEKYAEALRKELLQWDKFAPASLNRYQQGQLRRMKRGSFLDATWFENQLDGKYNSAVAVMPHEFNIMEHPLCRLIVVRPVKTLEKALEFMHPGVASAGVFPEERREELMVKIAARGVSNILPLGQVGYTYPGMPHDGMMVLSEMVDWKTA